MAVGCLLVAMCLLLNVRLVGYFFSPDGLVQWPNSLFVGAFQTLLLSLGALFIYSQGKLDSLETLCQRIDKRQLSLLIFLGLLAIDILFMLAFYLTRDSSVHAVGIIHQWVHLDVEKNLPSTYSALQILLASGAAALCSRVQSPAGVSPTHARYAWLAVSLILLYMAVDEYFSFHENTGRLVADLDILSLEVIRQFKQYGYAWTIIGGVFVVVLGAPLLVAYFGILRHYRYLYCLLVLAGGIFVGGAIGMENLQVYLTRQGSSLDPRYILMLEEFFEMLGMSIAVFVFLRFHAAREQSERTGASAI